MHEWISPDQVVRNGRAGGRDGCRRARPRPLPGATARVNDVTMSRLSRLSPRPVQVGREMSGPLERRSRFGKLGRAIRLRRVRKELAHRGISVAGMDDDELEAAIAGGHITLDRAKLKGGDTTAAFFTVVRTTRKRV